MQSAGESPSTLQQIVHRMSGLAGTVGFPTVSRRAAELESILTESAPASWPVDLVLDMAAGIREAFARDLAAPPDWSLDRPGPGQQLKILVAEDDDDQRAILESHLRHAGHAVTGVQRGDLVLQRIREQRPDIVLLDVNLPGLDGYSVCRLIKADPDLAATAVIIVTTRSELDDRLVGLALGADEFLSKPVDMRELLLRIQLLRRPAVSREAGHARAVSTVVDGELAYDAFVAIARKELEKAAASVALVRLPAGNDSIVAEIRDNIRRRDMLGRYDSTHVVLLLPDLPAAAARDGLAKIIAGLSTDAGRVHAGISYSPAPANRTIEELVADADEALAQARYLGEAAVAAGDKPKQSVPAGRARSVVLADDDPEVMRIVDAQMRAAGYETFLAFDGQQALSAVVSRAPDVLVLDLMMPKLSGFDLLTRLRDESVARPRVVVLSARGREDDVTRAFELGADDYVTKPFNPQELLARVARLLK